MIRAFSLAIVVSAGAVSLSSGQVRDAGTGPLPTGTASVSGTVVMDDADHQPVRKARVTLNSVTTGLPGRTVTTDDAGRFAFVNLPAGRYNLAAVKPGYLNANFGAKLQDRPGTPIAVADGQQMPGLMIRMAHGGVITGLVRDQNGRPAPGVGVSVLRYGYFVLTGERSLGQYSSGGSGSTDDRGVYRAYGLPPGDYVVMVTALFSNYVGDEMERLAPVDIQRAVQSLNAGRNGLPVAPTSPTAQAPPQRVAFAPVYFPGATDFARSTTITLAVGEERTLSDMQLDLVPTARIEAGMSLPDGVPPLAVVVTLVPSGPMAAWIAGPQQSKRLNPSGHVVMTGVAPGQYTLKARSSDINGRGTAAGLPPVTTYWAQADIVVDGHDQQITMDLQPGMAVKGRLAFEGTTLPPADLVGLNFRLTPSNAGPNLTSVPGGQTDRDGRFSFVGVPSDLYRVTYSLNPSWPRAWTLKSMTAAGKDVTDNTLEVKAGTDAELVVTFTDHPSELAGTLQDSTGRAAPDYFIVVFPADKAAWMPGSRRVRMIRPGNDGQFSLLGLPPGDYLIAALTDVVNGEWYNPVFLDGLVPTGIKVRMAEAQKTTQNLRIGR